MSKNKYHVTKIGYNWCECKIQCDPTIEDCDTAQYLAKYVATKVCDENLLLTFFKEQGLRIDARMILESDLKIEGDSLFHVSCATNFVVELNDKRELWLQCETDSIPTSELKFFFGETATAFNFVGYEGDRTMVAPRLTSIPSLITS